MTTAYDVKVEVLEAESMPREWDRGLREAGHMRGMCAFAPGATCEEIAHAAACMKRLGWHVEVHLSEMCTRINLVVHRKAETE